MPEQSPRRFSVGGREDVPGEYLRRSVHDGDKLMIMIVLSWKERNVGSQTFSTVCVCVHACMRACVRACVRV